MEKVKTEFVKTNKLWIIKNSLWREKQQMIAWLWYFNQWVQGSCISTNVSVSTLPYLVLCTTTYYKKIIGNNTFLILANCWFSTTCSFSSFTKNRSGNSFCPCTVIWRIFEIFLYTLICTVPSNKVEQTLPHHLDLPIEVSLNVPINYIYINTLAFSGFFSFPGILFWIGLPLLPIASYICMIEVWNSSNSVILALATLTIDVTFLIGLLSIPIFHFNLRKHIPEYFQDLSLDAPEHYMLMVSSLIFMLISVPINIMGFMKASSSQEYLMEICILTETLLITFYHLIMLTVVGSILRKFKYECVKINNVEHVDNMYLPIKNLLKTYR